MFNFSTSIATLQSSNKRRVASVSGGGGALLADWVARSTAAGVTQAIRFDTLANVNNYRHIDGDEGHISRNATGGILGDGCLHFDIPTTLGTDTGAWRCPMNTAWNTDGQGFGTADVYIQYRMKLGTNGLVAAGDAKKFSIFGEYKFSSPNSSSSHTSNELVIFNINNYGILAAYRDTASGATQLDRVDGAGIHLQPAIDHGSGIDNNRYCLYNSGAASAGCNFLVEQEWFTVYVHYKLANQNSPGTGNIFNLYIAHAGDTSYTQLHDLTTWAINADASVPLGPNAVWLLPYDTNRVSGSFNTDQEYDQLIVSTQPIACPI